MSDQKPEMEFTPADRFPWTSAHPDVPGLDERILATEGDGNVATRMLRFAPGTDTRPAGVQRHSFWEEVYILEGSFHDVELDRTFYPGEYACRPPGMAHGPWTSDEGCVTFEVRYTRPTS